MLRQVDSIRVDTLVYELDEFVTKEEILIIEEGIEFMLSEMDMINLMICINNTTGESFDALVKEFQLGLKYSNKINKVAYLTDNKNWKTLINIENIFTNFRIKYFNIDDIDSAWKWLSNDKK